MTAASNLLVNGLPGFSAAALRELAAIRLCEPETAAQGDHLLNPEFIDWVMSRATKPAAVLIPIVERREGLSVILTRRLDNLRSHSGQVAFPGGKIDPEDASPQAAALREAAEEVALDPMHAEIIGQLPDYFTGSGYKIAPVVALIDGAAQLRANPQEVDYIFEVPFEFLMNQQNHRRGSREFQGKERYYFEMPYGEHHIWGVTAGILRLLQERLFT